MELEITLRDSFDYLSNPTSRTKLLFQPSHLSVRMRRAPSLGALQSIDGERARGRVWARASLWREDKISGSRPPLGEVSEQSCAVSRLASAADRQPVCLHLSAGSVSWFRVKNRQHQSTAPFFLFWKIHVSLFSSRSVKARYTVVPSAISARNWPSQFCLQLT